MLDIVEEEASVRYRCVCACAVVLQRKMVQLIVVSGCIFVQKCFKFAASQSKSLFILRDFPDEVALLF
jgi:hypothetical protein